MLCKLCIMKFIEFYKIIIKIAIPLIKTKSFFILSLITFNAPPVSKGFSFLINKHSIEILFIKKIFQIFEIYNDLQDKYF